MELSENTIQVLKNFSGINSNIMVQEGNVLRSVTEARSVVARAEVTEQFPQAFGIYDLNEFISVLSLVDTPNLQFKDDYVLIGDASGRSKVKYFFSSEETLTTSQKDIKMPSADVFFTLDNDTLNRVKKAASVLGHAEVSITGDNGVLTLAVVDIKNSTSNAYEIDIDGEFNKDAKFNFVIDNKNLARLLSGDYEVQISSKLITQFKNKQVNVTYWIALEKTSTYGV